MPDTYEYFRNKRNYHLEMWLLTHLIQHLHAYKFFALETECVYQRDIKTAV